MDGDTLETKREYNISGDCTASCVCKGIPATSRVDKVMLGDAVVAQRVISTGINSFVTFGPLQYTWRPCPPLDSKKSTIMPCRENKSVIEQKQGLCVKSMINALVSDTHIRS